MPYIPQYRYFAPSRDEVLKMLSRFMTPEESQTLWDKTCQECHLDPQAPQLTLAQLRLIAQKFHDDADSIISIAGNSLLIRLSTYESIQRNLTRTEESIEHWKSLLSDRDRLSEIKRLQLFDPDVREMLDEITREVCDLLCLPVSLVSIVLDETQYFASHQGLENSWMGEAGGTPIEWSFCKNLVASKKVLVIEDARRDDRTRDIPIVEMDKVVCYAGTPLVTRQGHCIGSLCAIGPEGRSFSDAEIDLLRSRAKRVMDKLEERVA